MSGCVGYAFDYASLPVVLVRLDPMPSAIKDDILQLTLEDGRMIHCRVLCEDKECVHEGPTGERRHRRRRPPAARALL